tara:strand:+ start:321 stop:515 length:195 start_codon:yes stop_codon:yes gene_type:complete
MGAVLGRITHFALRRKLETGLNGPGNGMNLISTNHAADLVKPPAGLWQTPAATAKWLRSANDTL